MPETLKKRLFYDNSRNNKRGTFDRFGCRVEKDDSVPKAIGRPRQTQISRLVNAFTRSDHLEELDRQFRAYSQEHPDVSFDSYFQMFIDNEESSFRDRQDTAEKNILNNLNSEKYG